jgi:hypothetical protein
VTYTPFDVESDIVATSTIYYLNENYDGFYQFQFGNNILGRKPSANSIITIEYISSNALASNGATTFAFSDSYPTDTTIVSSNGLTTASNAAGGAERESIESIQFNAPRSFISQNRAVTSDDYAINVRNALGDVADVSVYGGDTLTPPEYGKVYISVKPQGSLFLTQNQKQQVLDYLSKKRIVTVTPVIIDADYTFLYFNIFPKYNSSLTSLTKNQLETAVRSATSSFNDTFLQSYGNNFRYSKFLSALDNTDVSIVGTTAQVFVYKKTIFDPLLTSGHKIDYKFQLLGDVNQEGSFITSTGWVYEDRTYYLEDVPVTGDENRRNVRRFYINKSNVKVVENANVGTLYPSTGILQLDAQPSTARSEVDITVIPISYDIPGLENKLLTIDMSKTNIFGNSQLKEASGSIVATNYVSAPQVQQTSGSYDPYSSGGNFVPHTMYDPNTGVAYYAATNALHLEYGGRGYVHYIPTISSAQTATTVAAAQTSTISYADQQASVASSSSVASGSSGGQATANPTPSSDGGSSGGGYGGGY